jgi:hypothetical protein
MNCVRALEKAVRKKNKKKFAQLNFSYIFAIPKNDTYGKHNWKKPC